MMTYVASHHHANDVTYVGDVCPSLHKNSYWNYGIIVAYYNVAYYQDFLVICIRAHTDSNEHKSSLFTSRK